MLTESRSYAPSAIALLDNVKNFEREWKENRWAIDAPDLTCDELQLAVVGGVADWAIIEYRATVEWVWEHLFGERGLVPKSPVPPKRPFRESLYALFSDVGSKISKVFAYEPETEYRNGAG